MNRIKKSTKILTAALILVEVAIIICILFNFQKNKIAAETASINSISKDGLSFPSQSDLKYFYEPKAGIDDRNGEPEWLKVKPTYHINKDSLRERYDYDVVKPSDTFRIIILGDSFTYGLFVGNDQNYSELLEDKLNNLSCSRYKKFEVINLGMQGYDIRYSEKRFELRGQKYDPDLVIWFLKSDDFDFVNEIILPKVDEYMAKLGGGWMEPKIFDVWGESLKDVLRQTPAKELTDYNILALKNFNGMYKNKLLYYVPKYLMPSKITDVNSVLTDLTKTRSNIFLYESELDLSKTKKVFPDNHPDIEGHKAIAQDLEDYVLANGLIDCK